MGLAHSFGFPPYFKLLFADLNRRISSRYWRINFDRSSNQSYPCLVTCSIVQSSCFLGNPKHGTSPRAEGLSPGTNEFSNKIAFLNALPCGALQCTVATLNFFGCVNVALSAIIVAARRLWKSQT